MHFSTKKEIKPDDGIARVFSCRIVMISRLLEATRIPVWK